MLIQYSSVPEWPPLAWLARCHRASNVVTVYHGRQVEITPDWFCEATWDGDYQTGNFDQTDIVAGSGCRVRNGKLTFVSSGSTLDRLNSMEVADSVWVSNSLPCLLAANDAQFDPSYPKYFQLLRTIVRGIDKYQRFLQTTAGRVQLTYFDNLVWDGARLGVDPKPIRERDFSNFSRYRAFLDSSMQLLAENIASIERKYTYRFLSTASSGYDSATVTTLAKQVGCREVLCFERTSAENKDSGEALSRSLALEPITVKRNEWRLMTMPEVPFISADADGGDVFFKGAESYLSGRILLTGFYGDTVWGKDAKGVNDSFIRLDQAGLSLTEYRLMAGFIHCPVAFWGVKQMREVNAISNSLEMSRWDVPGSYSRPICRRIIEGAGVSREIFGTKKRASWVRLHRSREFLTGTSQRDYFDWLKCVRWNWLRRGRVPPLLNLQIDELEYLCRNITWRAANSQYVLRLLAARFSDLHRIAIVLGTRPTRLRRYMFPWAIEHAKKAYPKPL